MDSLLPREQIAAKFKHPVRFEDLELERLTEIERRKPASLYELGLTVWTHHLEIEPATDPRALAEYVDRSDPRLVARIADKLGQQVLRDIQYTIGRVQDDELHYNVVAEVLAAFVYPGYFHISDVEFSNPYEPIPKALRKYRFQKYAGLRMFGVLLDRALVIGRNLGASHLSLTAAAPDLVPFFGRFGFDVENNAAGRYGLERGLSIPMRRTL